MKFESEKLSIRLQDGLLFNGILSQIYLILYEKFITFLPFYNEIMKFDNFVKSEVIKVLNEKGMTEKILDIYVDNKSFFEKRYLIKEKDIVQKTNNLDRASLIFEKMIEEIIFSDPIEKDNNIKKIVFGLDNSNIIDCPVIIKNQWNSLFALSSQSKNFFELFYHSEGDLVAQSYNFYPEFYNKSGVNVYYFEKNYFQNNIKNKKFHDKRGFHFETFVSFDFNKSKFMSSLGTSNADDEHELFLFSFLNTCFFLSKDDKPLQNIIINVDLFKKLFFPLDVQYPPRKEAEKNLKNFISNIKVGLRMVSRMGAFPTLKEPNKQYIADYNIEDYSLDSIKEEKDFFDLYTSSDKFAISYIADKPFLNVPQLQPLVNLAIKIKFTNLEKNVLKDKSFALFSYDPQNVNYIMHTWIPIVSVSSAKFSGEYTYQNINNFIDEKLDIEKLKDKMIKTKEFKFIFEKFIPIDIISLISKTSNAIKLKQGLDTVMSQDMSQLDLNDPKNIKIFFANTMKMSINNSVNVSTKDKQKEY